jgi:Uma2 family endonuclease
MAVLVTDPRLEEQLIEERRASGADHHDEVWEGIYMMAPLPNTEHQEIVTRLASIFVEVIDGSGLGRAFAGVNMAGQSENWEQDYRVPDLAIFLHGGPGKDCDSHWRGGADLLVEITSPGDQTKEKIPFYGRIGVKELLVVDRQAWKLDLYAGSQSVLEVAGESSVENSAVLTSGVVPLQFQLVAGEPRPQIEVTHPATGRRWRV